MQQYKRQEKKSGILADHLWAKPGLNLDQDYSRTKPGSGTELGLNGIMTGT